MKKTLSLLFLCICAFTAFSQNTTPSESAPSKPFVIGETLEIQSEVLAEKRILNVYLPAGYSSDDTTTYATLYLLDGGADEDFIHVAGLVQFFTFPWIHQMPNTIVIGIANVDRKRDFTYPTTIAADQKKYPTSGGSANFIAFIEKELQPFIQKKYKTNGQKMLVGQSLGGLLATEILFKKTYLFDKYVIVSPSIWWDNGALLKWKSQMLEARYANPTNIYIGVGKEGQAPGENVRIMEEDAQLLANKIKSTQSKSVSVTFDFLPTETHATSLHPAFFQAMRKLYPQPQ